MMIMRHRNEEGIAVFGEHDGATLQQIKNVALNAEKAALMADGHVGYHCPIGGVAAYRDKVSVVGVGFDIGCGNAAIRTDLALADVTDGRITRAEAERNPHRLASDRNLMGLANEIQRSLSFGIGRKNRAGDAPVDDPLFHDAAWWAIPNTGRYRDDLMEKARQQLGTVGSGNHYVDVFVAEDETVWVGVHFGSRGLGHTIATNFLNLSQGLDWGLKGAREVEVLLDLDRSSGSWAEPRWSWCTTTTTSPGARSTTARSSSSCERARRPPFPARRASSAAPWVTTP
jgi:tRNA-splicing ligase RtcB (3'-phosphate/5'-hydroxy nucleic acid ligase)